MEKANEARFISHPHRWISGNFADKPEVISALFHFSPFCKTCVSCLRKQLFVKFLDSIIPNFLCLVPSTSTFIQYLIKSVSAVSFFSACPNYLSLIQIGYEKY